MQQIKPHMMEYAAESIFMYTAYSRGGCRHAPYTPICASGPNGSTLHYGHAASPNGQFGQTLFTLQSCMAAANDQVVRPSSLLVQPRTALC